jgi:hypothetical protein
MATACIVYEQYNDGKLVHNLCFMCAVKQVNKADLNTHIRITSDDFEFYKCDICGQYISDRIHI